MRRLFKHTISKERSSKTSVRPDGEREGNGRRCKHTLTASKGGATTDSCRCTQREEEGCKEHKTDKVSPSFFVNKTEQREVHTEEVKVLETLDRILERD